MIRNRADKEALNRRYSREIGSSACGCIVFSNDLKRVALVESKRVDNWCPPKGGRERGEHTTDTALRELREESGILPDEIELIPSCYVDEISAKGNLSVRYRVTRLISKEDKVLKYDNPAEILQLGFYSLDEVSFLSPKRKVALDEAVGKAKEHFK